MRTRHASRFDFRSLPDILLDGLLLGGVGKLHLLQLGDACYRLAARPELGAALLVAAWQADLLDGGLARQALGRPQLAPENAVAMQAVAAHWRAPDAQSPFYQLARASETDALQEFFDRQFAAEPENCFWLQQALGLAVFERRFDWMREAIERVTPRLQAPLVPLVQKMCGDLAFLQGDLPTAAGCYGAVLQRLPIAAVQARLAETLFRRGKQDAALSLWRQAAAAQPWNVNLLLRLYECLDASEPRPASFDGRLAVLLYTYNRASDLDLTLERLWSSGSIRPPAARVCVLNNGSTDETGAVLARWRDCFGAGFATIELPVNVGAPAARNWLARSQELADCEWLVYLDDDALPPDNWLDLLAAAVQRYPAAAVWGCRVLDAHNPAVLQHVDLHLTDPVEPAFRDPVAPVYPARFGVSLLHHQDLDFGQFNYLRPCVSVTGCCHLFQRRRLLEQPPFDLRFSPSQFDDAEHDLALAAAGGYAVYQGRLAVLHRRGSGRQRVLSEADRARALGNQYKMHMKYSPETIAAIRAGSRRRLLEDLERKIQRLREDSQRR